MTADIVKKIIEDLEKVGFPTEVEISSKLEHAKWMVYNGALFEDPETGKDREIDIHSVYIDFSLVDNIPQPVKRGDENKMISHLIIEVKKTSKPWVFFDNGNMSWPQIPTQNFKSTQKEFHELLLDDFKKLGLKSHRYINAKLHKSYHVSFSSPSETSSIYEALVKTSKALDYFKSHYGTGGYSFHLFTPIIILDGSLWSATLDKHGKVKLKKVNVLSVVFTKLTKDERKISFEEEQLCDVITKESFDTYLHVIQNNNKELYKAWTNYRKQLDNKDKK